MGSVYPSHHLLQDTLRLVSQVQATLGCNPLRPGQLTRLRQVQIPVGSKLVYEAENTVHDNNSIEVYLQVSNAVEALEHCHHSLYGSTYQPMPMVLYVAIVRTRWLIMIDD